MPKHTRTWWMLVSLSGLLACQPPEPILLKGPSVDSADAAANDARSDRGRSADRAGRDVGGPDNAELQKTDAARVDADDPDGAAIGLEDAAALPDPPPAVNYLIVSNDTLTSVAEEFARYRQETGYQTDVVTVSAVAGANATDDAFAAAVEKLISAARQRLPDDETLFVLLLGDAPALGEAPAGRVPALRCPGDDGLCHTDNTYADLDQDGLPDVALGRIPAHWPAQARGYLQKLRVHESSYQTGPWNRRVVIHLGNEAYSRRIGGVVDEFIFQGLATFERSFDFVGVYNNTWSPYYYVPYADKVLELLNGGSYLTVYYAYGNESWVDGLAGRHLSQVDCGHRMPMSFFLSSLDGVYAGSSSSTAEALLWLPNGSIASVAASGISHPYGSVVLAYELNGAALRGDPATVGEVVLRLKRRVVENDSPMRRLIEDIVLPARIGADGPAVLNQYHVALFNLFGDPATATQLPQSRIRFETVTGSAQDGHIEVEGHAPGVQNGEAVVTLETDLDVILEALEPVDGHEPDPEIVNANWERANNKVITRETVPVADGLFEAELIHDVELRPDTYHIKVYAHDGVHDSFGAMVAP